MIKPVVLTIQNVKPVVLKWVSAILRAVLITGLLFLTQGCGAKYHLNRAIAKDPTILDSVVLKVDTTIITQKESVRDTIVTNLIDTITIENKSIRVDVWRFYDTLSVVAECKPDTIRLVKEIKVPQVVYKEKQNYGWLVFLGVLGLGVTGFFAKEALR